MKILGFLGYTAVGLLMGAVGSLAELPETWGVYDTHTDKTILECSADLRSYKGTPELEQFAQCHRRMQEAIRHAQEVVDIARGQGFGMLPLEVFNSQWDATYKECVQ